MKILLIGLIAFSGWSAVSTYIYVCKIKGLCNEPITMQMVAVKQNEVMAGDTIQKPLVQKQAALPENLTIYFAFDKSDFNANAVTDNYFNVSNAYLLQNSNARLSITGHTDAIGSDGYNQALGYRRAQSLQYYFESKGMPENKIIIESKGEKEPVENNSKNAGRAKNRRTEITIKK